MPKSKINTRPYNRDEKKDKKKGAKPSKGEESQLKRQIGKYAEEQFTRGDVKRGKYKNSYANYPNVKPSKVKDK